MRRPRGSDLSYVGAGIGVLMLFGVVVIAGIDAGDAPPRTLEIADWVDPDVDLEGCAETDQRLPARDPVTVYRCDVTRRGEDGSGCFAVDEIDVVAGYRQLADVPGCEPAGFLADG